MSKNKGAWLRVIAGWGVGIGATCLSAYIGKHYIGLGGWFELPALFMAFALLIIGAYSMMYGLFRSFDAFK